MPDENELRWVTVSGAVGALGKSERTIRRYIAIKSLPSKLENGKLRVGLPGLEQVTPEDKPAQPDDTPAQPDPARDVPALQAKLDAQQDIIEQLTGERDYLRQILAGAILEQKLIKSAPRRTFWQRLFGSD